MPADQLTQIIVQQWAVVVTALPAFFAAIGLGLIFGWLAAWVIFRQQLNHRRDLIDVLREALENKIPVQAALKRSRPVGANRMVTMGLAILAAGILISAVGASVIYLGNKPEKSAGNLPVSTADAVTISSKAERKKKLQEFYMSAGRLVNRQLPKDISEVDFKKYDAETNAWLNETLNWVKENMGDAAKARLLDMSGLLSFSYDGTVNEQHAKILQGLNNLRKNLQVLIVEFDAWDNKS